MRAPNTKIIHIDINTQNDPKIARNLFKNEEKFTIIKAIQSSNCSWNTVYHDDGIWIDFSFVLKHVNTSFPLKIFNFFTNWSILPNISKHLHFYANSKRLSRSRAKCFNHVTKIRATQSSNYLWCMDSILVTLELYILIYLGSLTPLWEL